MKKKSISLAEPISVILTVLMLGGLFLLPKSLSGKLLYLGACAVLPEGCLAEPSTCVETTEPTKAVQKTVSTVPKELTDTPRDILDWIEAAQKNADKDKKDGNIREMTYTKANATHFFGNILVRNVTGDVYPDYEKQWNTPLNLKVTKDAPAVFIYHTHTTEGYETLDRDFYAADVTSRTTDTNKNVARVGTAIAEELEKSGFQVIHDTTIYDTKYNGAYDRSRAAVEKVLEQYPNLMVALDVHRDAIEENNGTKVKPVTTIAGKKSAQIMIIAGAEGGNVKAFPQWEQNLRFAMHLQDIAQTKFPTLMRPIFFCHRKYNMDLTPCSLLVEFGSEANTLQEAEYAGRMFGRVLSELLEDNLSKENGT